MKTISAAMDGISDEAICRAAGRFVKGEVEGQSLRFAPSVPELVKEATAIQRYMDFEARPKITAPEPKPEPYSPPVSPEKMQALSDVMAGRMTWAELGERYGKRQ